MNSNIELDSGSLTHRGEFKPWWNLYLQHFILSWASLVAQMVKYLPAMWETLVWTLDQEYSLEKGMASHSSILAWRIPWTEGPFRLQSMGLQRVRHDWVTNTHRKNNSQFVWKYRRPWMAKTILRKKNSWRNQPSWLQTILQRYSYQDSMVLAQKQKYSSMEQDRKPRDKLMYLWTPYFWQRRQDYTMEKRQPLQ